MSPLSFGVARFDVLHIDSLTKWMASSLGMFLYTQEGFHFHISESLIKPAAGQSMMNNSAEIPATATIAVASFAPATKSA